MDLVLETYSGPFGWSGPKIAVAGLT